MALVDKQCVPCQGNVPPLTPTQSTVFLEQIDTTWLLNAQGHLERQYHFDNFVDAMTWANQVAQIAEEQNHHPRLSITWGLCSIELWTHHINGLSESDFILAAKIDAATAP